MYRERLSELLEEDSRFIERVRRHEQGNPTFVPVFITGGVGDGILLRSTFKRLRDEGYQLLVYSHHAEALRYFYKDMTIHKGDLPAFTWHLHLDSVAKFRFNDQFDGFLMSMHKLLFERQQRLFRRRHDFEFLLRDHPKYKATLAAKAVELGLDATTLPLYCLGFEDAKTIESLPRKAPSNYITIHDGFDLNNHDQVNGRCTKQWAWQHWNDLVKRLRAAYPEYEVIQLGARTSRPIDGAKDMLNKTTFTEAFDIISRSRLHIDTDSGLVHAAHAMSVPSVVIWGPSPKGFYGHPENANLFSTASCTGGCFHLPVRGNWQTGWMDRCPVGYLTPRCMDDVSPAAVMEAVNGTLTTH